MSEQESPETPAPERAPEEAQPFEPGPAGLSGCGKPAIIGCLVVFVLLGVGALVLISQSPKMLRWAMNQTRTQIAQGLPEDLSEEERERLDRAFDGAIAALMEGRVEPSSITNLQAVAAFAPRSEETLSRDEVAEITRLLEEIGGDVAPEPPTERPVPGSEAPATTGPPPTTA